MDKTNLLLEIELCYKELTKTEKKIADFVMKESERVLFMSITELADNCAVAEASVHRFCRALKIKGYQEFKMRLSLSLSKDNQTVDEAGNDADKNNGMIGDILQNHINAIRETNELLDEKEVFKTVKLMSEAENIVFLGVGNSMLTAEEAYGRFLHITNKVHYVKDTHMQSMRAATATDRDMFIFFSYSGDTTDNINIAQIAKQHDAKVAVITRYPKSPITKEADVILICGSKESPLEGGSMGSKMSQLHIIDVLFQYYYQQNLEISRKNNKETAKANLDKFS